jgi:probable H4MPT-linked C1 transfer pathway protein
MAVLGLDVGGANLKAASSAGDARSVPFALWKDPGGLADALRCLVGEFDAPERLAVTMTGELCDCFESKRQGVAFILDAVRAAAGGTPVLVWQTTGRFADPAESQACPLRSAAANWHALATFAGRFASQAPALLLDVGSTTTDVIPLQDGRPTPRGLTDPERLRSGELVYTGVRRTPLCALLGGRGAAEFFATTLDVYLVLGMLPEDPADRDTADGRPATCAAAHARLARMLCADLETSDAGLRLRLARHLRARQRCLLVRALRRVAARLPSPPRTVVLAGSGEFLAELALRDRRLPFKPGGVVSLRRELGEGLSTAACAYAAAVLAAKTSI